MAVLNFIVNRIFWSGSYFPGNDRNDRTSFTEKDFSAVVRGTLMTAIGFFVLNAGTGLITGSSIDGLSTAFNAILPQAHNQPDIDMSVYGTQIGIVMIIAFAFNLLFARFTKWKSIFLTGHML